MGWHEAYLAQARSEELIRSQLKAARVPYCHRLHYLQMVTEKLAKAMLTPAGSSSPAPTTHTAFVRMLQVIKGRREIRGQLGFADASLFRSFIDSLLDLAARIEGLSPDQAGLTHPNPEYPWEDPVTHLVQAPADYNFPQFDVRDPKMIKIDRLVSDLLRLAT
ncbi:MAG TPA: hypothetical protein VFE47_27780 [Tepidisphaeraceae bacterium]|jgi:hypothetical protein|nr:hypothetical protein [Tepidisphaeraceae bacterium]